jgi:hypothetical protein
MRFTFIRFSGALAALLIVSGVQAATLLYTYQGPNFTTISETCTQDSSLCNDNPTPQSISQSISGSLTYNTDTSTVLSYTFTDGLRVFADGLVVSCGPVTTCFQGASLATANISLALDVNDAVTGWSVSLAHFTNKNMISISGGSNAGDSARIIWPQNPNLSTALVSHSGDPGFWSAPVAVPIPAAVWLFGSALGLLGWMRRKAS